MKSILKRFEESVTKYKSDEFQRARVRLTLFYTIAMVIILVIFSLVVYSSFSKDILDNYNSEDSSVKSDQIEVLVVDNSLDNLQKVLVVSDLSVIILILFLGYYLSGQTLEPIESLLKKQRKFVADSAHELRTPLTVMKTGLQALQGTPAKIQEHEELSDEMLDEVDYMTKTVNDLLLLAQTDSFVSRGFNEINLGLIVRKQIKSMQNYAKDYKVELSGNNVNDSYIKGDQNQITILAANLIKNAIEYNRPGGTIEISLERKGHHTVLTVKDTGIGIPKDKIDLIFDRFYKVDQSRSKLSGGAGLGLSIVKEIVKIHGANVKAESEMGQGTVIRVSFPMC